MHRSTEHSWCKCKIYLEELKASLDAYSTGNVADSSQETAEARSSSGCSLDLDNYRVLGVENCKKLQDYSLANFLH